LAQDQLGVAYWILHALPHREDTDTLWLRTAGVQVDETALRSRIQGKGLWSAMRELDRVTELHFIDASPTIFQWETIDPDIAALGRLLSNKTGITLSGITYEIPEPSEGGGK
jgi:hypothetical protein